MILEHAVLDVRPAEAAAYEVALREALPLIAATPGFIDLEVRPCLERPGRYLLLVRWERLEDHTAGFRQSERYQRWRALLHRFYEPMPAVEHYGAAVAAAGPDA
jgi:heme-degrading monooxygenase HmoA